LSPQPATRCRLRTLTATLTTLTVLLAACSTNDAAESNDLPVEFTHTETEFYGTLLDPPPQPPNLVLSDTTGKAFDLTQRPGDEVTVLFFGYTHCPDVCPTTMADLAQARHSLPPEAQDRIQVVFVSEDPQRDSPSVVRRWLDTFDSDFIGLLGGNSQTKRILQELHLPDSQRNPSPSPQVLHSEDGHDHPGDYGLDHAGIVYAFGPAETVLYTGGTTSREYAEDLAKLAGGS
jgi:protein SCO1/2